VRPFDLQSQTGPGQRVAQLGQPPGTGELIQRRGQGQVSRGAPQPRRLGGLQNELVAQPVEVGGDPVHGDLEVGLDADHPSRRR
jgi:hypothetical protein